MTDALAVETCKDAVLRDASIPDAPLVMPLQVIEASSAKAARAPVGRPARRLSRLLSLLAQGFGRTARGG